MITRFEESAESLNVLGNFSGSLLSNETSANVIISSIDFGEFNHLGGVIGFTATQFSPNFDFTQPFVDIDVYGQLEAHLIVPPGFDVLFLFEFDRPAGTPGAPQVPVMTGNFDGNGPLVPRFPVSTFDFTGQNFALAQDSYGIAQINSPIPEPSVFLLVFSSSFIVLSRRRL